MQRLKLKKASKQQAAHAAEALFQAPSGLAAFTNKLLQVCPVFRLQQLRDTALHSIHPHIILGWRISSGCSKRHSSSPDWCWPGYSMLHHVVAAGTSIVMVFDYRAFTMAGLSAHAVLPPAWD